MTGMEMMISKLIGMTPEQMKKQVEEAAQLMKSGAAAMADIQMRLERIEQALNISPMEDLNNGGRAIANCSSGSANGNHIQL